MQVQVLLAELALVEEEIIWLERKVDKLKLSLYQEKKQTREWERLKYPPEALATQTTILWTEPPNGSQLQTGFPKNTRFRREYEEQKLARKKSLF